VRTAPAPDAGNPLLEALALGTVGGVLGWVVGDAIDPVLGVALGAVAGANGVLSGWRRIYPLRTVRGMMAFVLDSTWAALPVAGGLLAHAVAAVRSGGYLPELSRRRGHHVYRRGAAMKRGFAFTIGNVISGAGDVERPRRAKLIADHEAVHVWQARWFGPLYPVLYATWSVGGVLVGVLVWLRRGRRERLGAVIESCAYYLNPFEWWAYSRDALWPPPGLVEGLGWRSPATTSFAELRGLAAD
jgi:hypothetical protein